MAFLFTGVSDIAQDEKNEHQRYLELDEHPTFKGGGPNNFTSWVATRVKYPKDAKRSAKRRPLSKIIKKAYFTTSQV